MLRLVFGIVAVACFAAAQENPRPIFQPKAKYSEEARKLGVNGSVHLKFIVDEHGKTENVFVTQRIGFGLDEKAMEAVRLWKFVPVQQDGKATAVESQTEIGFPPGEERGPEASQPTERLTFDLPVKTLRPVWKNGTSFGSATSWTVTGHHAEVEFDVAQDGSVSNVRTESYAPDKMKEMVRSWKFSLDKRRPKKSTGLLEIEFP